MSAGGQTLKQKTICFLKDFLYMQVDWRANIKTKDYLFFLKDRSYKKFCMTNFSRRQKNNILVLENIL